nr:helix-turn-helix transcriptional regulator [Vibrio cholerae]
MFRGGVRDLRVERDLNQEEVANGIGVGKNTYLAYEKGHTITKTGNCRKISKILWCTNS